MTISSTTVKNSYSGNGSNDTFVYGFKIFANTDLQVIIRSAAGTETTKTLTTHYTVTGVGSASGGNVVFTAGNIPTATETVVLIRNVPQTQAIDYIANDPFPAETHEEGLDRATMTTQQVQEELNRSIKLSRTNTMTSTEFTVGATERANKILAFDSAGEISVTQELGTYQGTDATVTTEAYVVRDIVKSTTTAQLNNVYICIANSVVGDSLTDTDHFELLVDAVSAATSATAAATSATASATSATASATSATASANSATAAATSATNAATSETNAAASFDSFDDRYLGAKSSDPTVDNDGNALLTGALYFNSSDNVMKNYTGSAWETLKPSSSEQTNINTLAAADVVADMAILATADIVADMNTLGTADVVSDMNTLATADVVSDMNTLATADVVADMNTLGTADVVADMNTLGTADVVSDMNTLGTATNVTNMATVAANITGVNSFAERYRVESSDPSTSLDEGDLAFNTTDNNLKFYNGTAWTAIAPGISNVVDDSTPQLGGNLDVNSNSIVSVSNGDIAITPNGTGSVVIDGLSHPQADGSSGQFLKTDGAGNLSFDDPSFTLSYTKATATGDGSTTTLTIDSGRAVDDVLVYVNGFLLTPTTDYTISGTTLTFTTAPANSAEIVVRYLPLNNSGIYTNDTATGDNSTTAFTIDSGRTVEDVIVTVNGVTLVPATDYTISGTTLTFTTAPTTSAEISIRYLRLT